MARVPPPGDRLSFQANHALLNPHFEHYKLAPPPHPPVSVPLPPSAPFRTAALPDHARLSYQEVAARARHNHLAPGHANELVFVDADGQLTALTIDPNSAEPSFHPLLRLPACSSPPSPTGPVSEYPSALPLAPFLWLVTDGRGHLHRVRIDPTASPQWSAALEASFVLCHQGDDPSPFRLHAAEHLSADSEALVLLSVVNKTASTTPAGPSPSAGPATVGAHAAGGGMAATTRHTISSSTSFTYLGARVPLNPSSPSSTPAVGNASRIDVAWRLTSRDLPSFVRFDAARGAFVVGAGSKLVHAESAAAADTPALDVPEWDGESGVAGDEDVLMTPAPAPAARSASGPIAPKPAPFSWVQDRDAVTVAFPLPVSTPTSSIRVTLSRAHLTLHVASASAFAASSSGLPGGVGLPRVSHKRLWAEIDPTASVWTFDREAEGRDAAYGVLTLHLEKAHAGTRWSDVFAQTARADDDDDEVAGGVVGKVRELDPEAEYEGVPETLDPSELVGIAERMAQWAQGLATHGLGHSEEGLGSGVPTSLTGEEVDVEVDAESGRPFVVTWIEGAAGNARPRLVHPHAGVPYELLSTALPLAGPPEGQDPTLAIKHDVDALLFAPPPPPPAAATIATGPADHEWSHAATLPALAFVLATKRDTRFVHHLVPAPSSPAALSTAAAVLAFDAPALFSSGAAAAGGTAPPKARDGATLFGYLAPALPRAKTGAQLVVRVGDPGAGALLGVAGIELADGERAAVWLCEREVGVVRVF
ncbi:hypothetical protein JCM3770_005720 [Rhodotorula araucariae]